MARNWADWLKGEAEDGVGMLNRTYVHAVKINNRAKLAIQARKKYKGMVAWD